MFIYDLQCNLLEQYTLCDDNNYITVDSISTDGKYAFGDDYESLFVVECDTGKVKEKLSKEQCEYDSECTYMFSNGGDMCVIIDKTKGECRSYDVSQGVLLNTVDINATYIENVIFSENDNYVYFVYEDGLVSQYVSATMEHKCDVEGLDSVTSVIVEKTQNNETSYYFYYGSGAYVLKEYDGLLKVEQNLRHLEAMMLFNEEYWFVDYKTLVVLPIYTYEEMLGKADRICYDNSLWNNN